jgi:hypothetical protein
MDESSISQSSKSQARILPRARALIEFVDGDFSRVPIVYPTTGSDEMDEVVCREILKRWDRG